jgi:hypothetical protein
MRATSSNLNRQATAAKALTPASSPLCLIDGHLVIGGLTPAVERLARAARAIREERQALAETQVPRAPRCRVDDYLFALDSHAPSHPTTSALAAIERPTALPIPAEATTSAALRRQ